MATVSLTVESGTRSPAASAKSLGLVPMDAAGGTTQAVAEANSGILNDYFDDGWEAQGLTVELAGKGYALWDTVNIDKEGFTVRGAGLGDTRAEVEYSTRGGGPSRLVGINPDMGTVINYTGAFLTWSGVHLCGSYHATSNATLKSATELHVARGFYQGVQNDGKGTGKVVFPAGATFSCFGSAMVFGEDYSGDNADQWYIPVLRTLDCAKGFHVKCRQSVGFHVGQHEGTRTGVLAHFERGGKLVCGQATLENGATTLLQTRAQTFDDNAFWYGDVYVDGTVGGNTAKLLQMDAVVPDGDDAIPSTGDDEVTPSLFMRIGMLHVGTGVTVPPKFYMRGYSRLHIHGGEQLFANMVEYEGGSSSFMGDLLCQNARFRSGQDPTDWATMTGTTGYARVVLRNNGNVGNVPFNDEYKFLSRVASVTTPTNYDPMTV